MELREFTTETTDPRERGHALGERWAEQIVRTSRLYLDHFAALGIPGERVRGIAERSHAALRAWYPALAEESDAMADAAGAERWHVAAVGARTEILAAAPPAREGECSTAVYAPPSSARPASSGAETIQTWDWHSHLAPEGLLHRLTPAPGRTVKLFTEFGVPAKIGVNSAGLGLHFNILSHTTDDDEGGVPVHAVARRVLDEADTVEEAAAIAASARVSASTVLTVVGRGPDGLRAASLELSPAGMAVVPADGSGWILHTNHFLDAQLSDGDTIPVESTTKERFEHLERVHAAMAGLPLAERARALCGAEGHDAPVCMRPDLAAPLHEQWSTLLTISLDTEACALDVVAGSPDEAARAGFHRF
ncbi:C45 family peptidase [Sinomonas sp. ASV322]|uniref:C45 family peptidase n=1 Tax=Sinomonas sp. ASV322 TaxID=3041920 RepID=UPI0027DD8238|nr:C45 family peptidase [Sinomonas sp. ASV322]MDQ4501546.1 C45 family peptidase [Sinomonas sp. ASV322]